AGWIEKGTGMVMNAPNLGWREVPFLKLVQARAPRLPMWIGNDLSVAAWGERAAGAGRGVDDLIVVLVGSGVGAGIILDGRLLEEAGNLLGIALANLVTVLNPARLLLGGGVLAGSPRMMRATTEQIDAHTSKAARKVLKISAPELGDHAGVVGAALLARASLAEA